MAIGAVGCGGGGSSDAGAETTTVAGPVSKAEFVVQANAACKEAKIGLKERISDYLALKRKEGPLTPLVYAGLAHYVILPTIETELAYVYRLGYPPGEKKGVQAVLYPEQRTIDELANTEKIASIKAIERSFIESGSLMRDYGLISCANGPQPR